MLNIRKMCGKIFRFLYLTPCDYIAENLKEGVESLEKEAGESILTYLNKTKDEEND